MRSRSVVSLAFVFEGALLLVAFGLGALIGHPPFDRLRSDPMGTAIGAGAGVALLVALLPAMRSDWPPLRRLSEVVRNLVREHFADASLFDLAIVAALAGVAEEALFRGVIQTSLLDPLGTVGAILVAGALFGLAHAITLAYAVVAAGMGVALGALLAATGDLAAPILAHAVYDFLALVWLVRIEGVGSGAGPDPPIDGEVSTPEGRTR